MTSTSRVLQKKPNPLSSLLVQEAADECVRIMNGRFFGGRQLEASKWDGFTNFNVKVCRAVCGCGALLDCWVLEVHGQMLNVIRRPHRCHPRCWRRRRSSRRGWSGLRRSWRRAARRVQSRRSSDEACTCHSLHTTCRRCRRHQPPRSCTKRNVNKQTTHTTEQGRGGLQTGVLAGSVSKHSRVFQSSGLCTATGYTRLMLSVQRSLIGWCLADWAYLSLATL